MIANLAIPKDTMNGTSTPFSYPVHHHRLARDSAMFTTFGIPKAPSERNDYAPTFSFPLRSPTTRPICRTACRSRSSFSTSAIRKIAFARRAEAAAGADGDVALFEQHHARSPSCSSALRHGSGIGAQHEHAGLAAASTSQPMPREAVAPARRGGLGRSATGLSTAASRVPQRDDRRDLNRLEHAVVVVALDRAPGPGPSRALPQQKPTRQPAML